MAGQWLKENSTLVGFLVAQGIALITGSWYGLSYMVNLENRVKTLETRGSPHLAEINNRLTVTEKETTANEDRLGRLSARLDKVIDVLTRDLGKTVPK